MSPAALLVYYISGFGMSDSIFLSISFWVFKSNRRRFGAHTPAFLEQTAMRMLRVKSVRGKTLKEVFDEFPPHFIFPILSG